MTFYDLGWFVAAVLFLYGLASTGACLRLADRAVRSERAKQRELREANLEDVVGETYIQSS